MNTTEERIEICDGKYTVIHDAGANLRALRYGKPWRDMTGDGMVLGLTMELAQAREQLAAATQEAEKQIRIQMEFFNRAIEQRDSLQQQVTALRGALERFVSNGTRDDGIDPEAYWIELSEEEYRSLQTLVHGDEQLSGSGGNMSAKTEDKQPPRELRCRHGILLGHCPNCPDPIDWDEVERNEGMQQHPRLQQATLQPAAPVHEDTKRLNWLESKSKFIISTTGAHRGYHELPSVAIDYWCGKAGVTAGLGMTPATLRAAIDAALSATTSAPLASSA